jgi:hypothetical protein
MAKKFSKKAFRSWLDTLAKVCVKTRDNYTCQIKHDDKCAGRMQPLDKNCQWCHIESRSSNNWRWSPLGAICGCGHCHAWAHSKPVQFGIWFADKYPIRNVLLSMPISNHTWRESDFKDMERRLLEIAVILKVDVLNVPTISGHRRRFEIRIKNEV